MAMRIKVFLSLVIVILVVALFGYKWIDNRVKNGNSLIIKNISLSFVDNDIARECFKIISREIDAELMIPASGNNRFILKEFDNLKFPILVALKNCEIKYEIAFLQRNMRPGDEERMLNDLNEIKKFTAQACRVE